MCHANLGLHALALIPAGQLEHNEFRTTLEHRLVVRLPILPPRRQAQFGQRMDVNDWREHVLARANHRGSFPARRSKPRLANAGIGVSVRACQVNEAIVAWFFTLTDHCHRLGVAGDVDQVVDLVVMRFTRQLHTDHAKPNLRCRDWRPQNGRPDGGRPGKTVGRVAVVVVAVAGDECARFSENVHAAASRFDRLNSCCEPSEQIDCPPLPTVSAMRSANLPCPK